MTTIPDTAENRKKIQAKGKTYKTENGQLTYDETYQPTHRQGRKGKPFSRSAKHNSGQPPYGMSVTEHNEYLDERG
jgi:hypothetical protein